jgi:hypothetical protein
MFLLLLYLGTILAPICPVSCQLSCSLPPLSGSVGAAWFHPFSRSRTAPTRFCTTATRRSPCSFTIQVGSQEEVVAVSRLKAFTQQTPCLAARVAAEDCRICAQAASPQPSGSRFQTRWFLRFLLPRHRHETVPKPFSYPAGGFCTPGDRRRLHSLHRRGTRPINRHRPEGWTSDLVSSQLRPELGGALWRATYAPGDSQTSPAYSSQSVQCLNINHLLSVNKLVLSYLLLRLLPKFLQF